MKVLRKPLSSMARNFRKDVKVRMLKSIDDVKTVNRVSLALARGLDVMDTLTCGEQLTLTALGAAVGDAQARALAGTGDFAQLCAEYALEALVAGHPVVTFADYVRADGTLGMGTATVTPSGLVRLVSETSTKRWWTATITRKGDVKKVEGDLGKHGQDVVAGYADRLKKHFVRY